MLSQREKWTVEFAIGFAYGTLVASAVFIYFLVQAMAQALR